MIRWVIASLLFSSTLFAAHVERLWSVPLKEAGQSGICVQGDQVYLTIHGPIDAELKGGLLDASDVIGQCFDAQAGALKWEVELPGNNPGTVLEAWHDSTSLKPVADEQRVLFQNLNGMILCCNHDGEELWRRSFVAPEPDIKNARMYLLEDQLIVALPSAQVAVPANAKHDVLPFYQLHGLDLETGKDRWVSSVLQSHATQYSLDLWKGDPVIATSLIDLSHWKFGKGRYGCLVSLKDGAAIHQFNLPACIPHQKNQLFDGQFLITMSDRSRTLFKLVDPKSGAVIRELGFEQPDRYYSWTGEGYEIKPYEVQFNHGSLKGRKYPTPSTVHGANGRIFFLSSTSPGMGCIDGETGVSTLVHVPIQVLKDRAAWRIEDIDYTKGVLNRAGKVLNQRSKAALRGPQWGGYGHVNPAYPVRDGNDLYWQGGLGTLYRIDLEKEFSPDAISWVAVSDEGGRWSFGAPAVGADGVYLRSQLELVKVRWVE